MPADARLRIGLAGEDELHRSLAKEIVTRVVGQRARAAEIVAVAGLSEHRSRPGVLVILRDTDGEEPETDAVRAWFANPAREAKPPRRRTPNSLRVRLRRGSSFARATAGELPSSAHSSTT